ncbi:heavy-metal-associated domain-containing protein [Microbacterium sp. NE2HP2]|jgi:copper chaperone CopZ|uniref:Copper chaperone n=3 Tax=Microbacterium TaxID=33882 RepID=A0ABU1I1I2_9MICO|nr:MULTISPECIES: heavy-metal-associated domain-containing protein [Microbacterium]MDF2917977.1 copper-transporting ATPase [Microbacterium sp.]APF35521.1 copper-transporting ATPase [Microbacterium paludicola]MDD7944904.1 heavy-metal-associated domain-containing protein [Microbacterium plantarum]MDQ1215590.1 copper chaperone [Microbacterium arborescens]MDR6166958.1 copper chaperone [Microbacterium paludicola]
MTTQTYTVEGMTCGHCAAAVTRELGLVPGVSDVAVDVDAGTVAVTAVQPPDDDVVSAAVAEAGYTVTGRR